MRTTAFMFHGASRFRGAGLDTWDVQHVRCMSSMFGNPTGEGDEAGATGIAATTKDRIASLWFEQTPYFPVEYLGWNAGMRPPPPPPLRDAPPSPPITQVNHTDMEEVIQDEEETVPWTAVAAALILGLALSGCIVLMIFRRRRGLGWGI